MDVYRVEYYTTDFNGALVIGSGLYADPVTSRPENVVLYTHGTSVTIWDTPSNVSGEVFDGPTVLINVAGRGGLKLLMPDGTGFWTSTVPQHRYLMGEVEGRTAIDMWTAVQQSSVFQTIRLRVICISLVYQRERYQPCGHSVSMRRTVERLPKSRSWVPLRPLRPSSRRV